MCGLFGWNYRRKSRLEIGKRECLSNVLAIANSLRGDKSWGIYVHSKTGAHVKREVGDICEVPDLGQMGRLPLVMGHTRWPTMGKVTEKNAHPFTIGDITLAHNGTISNSLELDKKYGRDVSVDSQHFAHHLNEGLDFSDIEGYGSITWVHKSKPDRVYLCRMRSGSLSIYGLKNGLADQVGVVWSSDSDHLRGAIGASRIDAFPYEFMVEGKIYYVEGGKLFESGKDEKKLELSRPSYETARGYYGSYTFATDDEDRGYWKSKGDGTWTWVPKAPSTTNHVGNRSAIERMDDRRMYGGYGGCGIYGPGTED